MRRIGLAREWANGIKHGSCIWRAQPGRRASIPNTPYVAKCRMKTTMKITLDYFRLDGAQKFNCVFREACLHVLIQSQLVIHITVWVA